MLKHLLILLVGVSSIFGQIAQNVIPEDRIFPWIPDGNIGRVGGWPANGSTTVYTNLNQMGADSNGVVGIDLLLKQAGNFARSNSYIDIGPGIYKVTNWNTWNQTTNGWILRGTPGTNVIIRPVTKFFASDALAAGAPFRVMPVARLTNVISTAGFDASPYIGYKIRLSGNNMGRTNLQLMDIFGGDRTLSEIFRVTNVVDLTNMYVDNLTGWDYPSEVDPWALFNFTKAENIAFENLVIENGSESHFDLSWTSDVYIRNIRAIQGAGYFINSANGYRYTIAHCGFYSTNSGSGSAGILTSGDSSHLMFNLYCKGASPIIEANNTVKSAFAYIYGTNNVSNDYHIGNPFDFHVPHSMMNLWEGCSGTMFQSDSYFGSSSHNTLFRNHLHTWDPIKDAMPRAVDLGRWSDSYNIVGNVLGSPLRSGWYFIMTNRFAADSIPRIYNEGYPHPGNSAYKANQQTPWMAFRFPGEQNRVGIISNTFTIPTNRIGMNVFTNVAAGDYIWIQITDGDTNKYYPMNTNFVRLTVVDTNAGYIEVNRDIIYTNGHTIYKIGDGSFFEGHYNANSYTHIRHMNYDYTNNGVVVGTNGIILGSNLVSSMLWSERQDWMTNRRNGTNMAFPFVNPTNATVGDLAARSMWEDGDPDPAPGIHPVVTNLFNGKLDVEGKVTIQ